MRFGKDDLNVRFPEPDGELSGPESRFFVRQGAMAEPDAPVGGPVFSLYANRGAVIKALMVGMSQHSAPVFSIKMGEKSFGRLPVEGLPEADQQSLRRNGRVFLLAASLQQRVILAGVSPLASASALVHVQVKSRGLAQVDEVMTDEAGVPLHPSILVAGGIHGHYTQVLLQVPAGTVIRANIRRDSTRAFFFDGHGHLHHLMWQESTIGQIEEFHQAAELARLGRRTNQALV